MIVVGEPFDFPTGREEGRNRSKKENRETRQRRDAVTLSLLATVNEAVRRQCETEHRSFLAAIHRTRATRKKRTYRRAVATRLVIQTDFRPRPNRGESGRTDGRTDGREREGGSVSCVRAREKRWSRRERERQRKARRRISRDAGTFYCLGPRSRAPVIY